MKQMLAALGLLFTGFIGLMVMSSIINGFVLTKLWAWFMVPAFGLPQLSIPIAIGVSMVVKYLTYQKPPESKDENNVNKIGEALGFVIFYPLITLFIGWVVHFFV